MSVKHITIGRSVVDKDFTLSAAGQLYFDVDKQAGKATLCTTLPESVFDAAYDKLMLGGYRYISSINGEQPNEDGLLMLNGDRCLSWQHAPGEITLYDLCPACSSCDLYAELIRRLEQCKIALNMLKDANLYDNDILQSRKATLENARAELHESCEGHDPVSRTPIFSSELLKQYATMVHMWNYLVTTIGMYNEVVVAPDSPSGVSVRTAYTVSNCNTLNSLMVAIEISPLSLADGLQPLSLYVARREVAFIPSEDTPDDFPTVVPTLGAGTTKTVMATFGAVNTAGTYVLTATFLPFVYAQPVEPEPPDTRRTYIVSENNYPTYDDYCTSIMYPSEAVSGMCTWRVVITWTLDDGKARNIVRTYEMRTATPRNIATGLGD